MTKNEIMKDMAFIQQCRIFGLDCRNFEVFDDVILVNTPQKDLYVLLDKNYNTIGIERIISDCSREDKISIVKRKYSEYCSTTISVYPFENFTLKQIMDIARKIEIIETNHGHSFDTLIDGQLLDTKTNKDKDCSQLLSYIKFLGEKIDKYFTIDYHFKTLRQDLSRNIHEYVRSLITQINQSINTHIENNSRPWPVDVMEYIGQNGRDCNFDQLLYDVIDLMMKDKGFKVKGGRPNKIEAFKKQEPEKNLSSLHPQVLKILDESEENVTPPAGPVLRKQEGM